MNVFSSFSDTFGSVFGIGWDFFRHGGWVVFILLIFYLYSKIRKENLTASYLAKHTYTFLHVKVEKENLQSLLAVEQLFTNLHALHTNFTFAERWFEGAVNLWLSIEIVSIGGKISFIVRTPDRALQLVQSAFYAHFPNAEITVVDDYMTHLHHWDPEHSAWDLWGTEFLMKKQWAYPIKTWPEFEHSAAEEPILDPLAPLYEALSRAEPHELIAVQYIMRPIADGDWVPKSEALVKKLKEEEEHHQSALGKIMSFGGNKGLFESMAGAASGHGGHGDEKPQQPKTMRMTEGEREVLLGIEEKMQKPAWETKLRMLYIAPKDKFDGTKKSSLIGAYRGFSNSQSNVLKPDTAGTWTSHNYALFKKLEKPFVDFMIFYKKEEFLKGFVNRSRWIGAKEMLFNVEELATLIHLPLAAVKTSSVERIDVKKGQPPANLPVAESETGRAY